jgi:small-conductance mechanosensitive channel
MYLSSMISLIDQYYAPVLMVVSGFVVGLLVEKILISRLVKWAEKTKWKSDDILIKSLKNLVWPLFLIGGIYLALHHFDHLPQRVQKTGDSIVSISYILIITIYFSRILAKFVHYQTYDENKQGTSTILMNLVKTIILSVGVMIALQSVGVSIQPLLTALGITGLAVALALQSTLSNFFSGLHIIASKRLSPGDYIRIDQNVEGYISDINWRSTTIRQLSNNIVIIPNSKLADAIVVNTYLPDTATSMAVPCTISYDNDLDRVEDIVLHLAREAIRDIDGCVPDAEPVVRFQSFEDNCIKFSLYLMIYSYPEQFKIRHEFIKRLHSAFNKENITMALPAKSFIIKESNP